LEEQAGPHFLATAEGRNMAEEVGQTEQLLIVLD